MVWLNWPNPTQYDHTDTSPSHQKWVIWLLGASGYSYGLINRVEFELRWKWYRRDESNVEFGKITRSNFKSWPVQYVPISLSRSWYAKVIEMRAWSISDWHDLWRHKHSKFKSILAVPTSGIEEIGLKRSTEVKQDWYHCLGVHTLGS